MSKPISEFSLLCRLFGTLFYRSPQSEVLAGVFQWLAQDGLRESWALVEDDQINVALNQVQGEQDLVILEADYQALNQTVSFKISDYQVDLAQFIHFRLERGMPDLAQPDQVGLLLLTASWVEDNAESLLAQKQLFEQFILPVMAKFLGQIEAHATTAFYRSVARLTRVALSAMADELEEAVLAVND